jgi:hypothetical protein
MAMVQTPAASRQSYPIEMDPSAPLGWVLMGHDGSNARRIAYYLDGGLTVKSKSVLSSYALPASLPTTLVRVAPGSTARAAVSWSLS